MSEAVSKHVHLSRGSIGPFVGGEHECEACLARESALADARAELDALRARYEGDQDGCGHPKEWRYVASEREFCWSCEYSRLTIKLGEAQAERDEAVGRAEAAEQATRHANDTADEEIKMHEAARARIALLEGVLRTEPDVVSQEAYSASPIDVMAYLRKLASLDEPAARCSVCDNTGFKQV